LTRIYWDSMLFIYLMEDHPQYASRLDTILGEMARRRHQLCTGALSLGETLVPYYRTENEKLAARVRSIIAPPQVEFLPFTPGAADRFARIRAAHNVTPADAIHLATAAEAGVRLFLTNDRRLSKLAIDGIDFIAGLDVNIY